MKTKGYLLDTNICISMLKNKYGVREAILKAKAENCYVSEITLGELYFGASFSDNGVDRDNGLDMGAYPNPRTITMGVRVNF